MTPEAVDSKDYLSPAVREALRAYQVAPKEIFPAGRMTLFQEGINYVSQKHTFWVGAFNHSGGIEIGTEMTALKSLPETIGHFGLWGETEKFCQEFGLNTARLTPKRTGSFDVVGRTTSVTVSREISAFNREKARWFLSRLEAIVTTGALMMLPEELLEKASLGGVVIGCKNQKGDSLVPFWTALPCDSVQEQDRGITRTGDIIPIDIQDYVFKQTRERKGTRLRRWNYVKNMIGWSENLPVVVRFLSY